MHGNAGIAGGFCTVPESTAGHGGMRQTTLEQIAKWSWLTTLEQIAKWSWQTTLEQIAKWSRLRGFGAESPAGAMRPQRTFIAGRMG